MTAALRVAVIGCGKIAEQHVEAIRRTSSAEIVAACDLEPLMAEQLAERHAIPYRSGNVADMLRSSRPDVVHITTPPASHLPLALECLDAGCHVYVEKPFTLDAAEASTLIRRASSLGLHVAAGHNLQYTWESLEASRLVQRGYLGGPPVHIESYYTYALGDAQYARALLGDRGHWVRRLPGKLLHNIISHGIARIAEFMHAEHPRVAAFGHTSPLLRSIGETELVDELRVHVWDGDNTTASFVFSSQISPPVNGFRLHGPRNSLFVDNIHRTVLPMPRQGYKSYVNHVLPPVRMAGRHVRAAARNIRRFAGADFHDDSGLRNCAQAFYDVVLGRRPPGDSARQILLVAEIMDRIFEQLAASDVSRAVSPRAEGQST